MKTAPPNGKSAPTNGAAAAGTPLVGRATTGGSVDKRAGSIDKGSIDKGSMDKASIDKGSIDKGGSRDQRNASLDKGGKKAGKKPMTPEQQKQLLVVVIAAVVVLAVGLSMYAYFHRTPTDHRPRLNAPHTEIAAFIPTNDFDQLPYEKQRQYIKELSNKKKELEADFKAGKFNKKQFEEILAIVWIGKQLDHVDKYYSYSDLEKKWYLNKRIDEEKIEKATEPPKGKDDPERDKEKVKSILNKMPDAERRALEGFRQALKEREKQRDREDKQIAKAAKNSATRPTQRPTDRPGNTPAAPSGATNPATPAAKPAAAGATGK